LVLLTHLKRCDSSLRYDFDMYYADNIAQAIGGVSISGRTNLGKMRTNEVVAVFRDKSTAEAVMAAPPIIRLFLEEAGFGVKVAQTRQADGSVPHHDPNMRRLLVKQLSEALSNRAMKKALGRVANESAFNVHEFIAKVVEKEHEVGEPDLVHHCEVAADLDDLAETSKVKPRRPSQLRTKSSHRRARPH